MNSEVLLLFISFVISLYLGLSTVLIDIKPSKNKVFFIMCLCHSLASFFATFQFMQKDKDIFIFWFHFSCAFFVLFWTIILHFCLEFTKIIKFKKIINVIIYIPAAAFIYKSLTSNSFVFKDFIMINNKWIFTPDTSTLWFYLYMIYITSYIFISMILLLLYLTKVKTTKEKKQTTIILTTLLITFIAGTVEEIILPVISSYKSPGPAPTFFIIWMSGIFYSIIKYRFLSITPELVSRDIISNIDESLILLDKEYHIITINKTALSLLNYSKNDIRSTELSKIILEYDTFINEIKNLFQGIHKNFSARINYINKEGVQILMDANISIIKDKFQDIIGVMIIGKEVKELKQFKTIYKITDRQAEIVQDIINGKTNKEIAEKMGIAERTIKGHITGIYDKLGVDNKIQLFNLLKDFNLIPESKTEKKVQLLKRGDC